MKKVFFIILICLVFLPQGVFAGKVYFDSKEGVKEGEVFELEVKLDTEGESINSFEFEIAFSQEYLNFSGYRENDTNLNIWIQPPKEVNGKIILSGIIPGGLIGVYNETLKSYQDVVLTKLLFSAKKNGMVNFTFDKAIILKNDGKGTEIKLDNQSLNLNLEKNSNSFSPDKDVLPPSSFEIKFIKKTDSNPNMIIFNAEDLGSGIQRYEIKVGSSDWREAGSPFEVEKGIFSKKVLVRAYDFSGNAFEANSSIPGLIPSWVIIILSLFILGILLFRMLKYRNVA